MFEDKIIRLMSKVRTALGQGRSDGSGRLWSIQQMKNKEKQFSPDQIFTDESKNSKNNTTVKNLLNFRCVK